MSDPLTEGSNYEVKLLLLSGRSGSGKSSTAFEICHILRSHKVMHVHIDADNLDAMYPREDESSELMLRNLRSMWETFWMEARKWWTQKGWAIEGRRTFTVVLSGTGMVLQFEQIREVFTSVIEQTTGKGMETGKEMVIASEMVALEVFPIILQASNGIVEERLRRRELGGELDEHLKSTMEMAEILKSWDSNSEWQTLLVCSEGREVNEIAQEVIDSCKII